MVTEEEHLKVLPVLKIVRGVYGNEVGVLTDWSVIFDVNQIDLNSVIVLEVPKGQEGLFVGKRGWQVKEWCQKLGLKRINVVGI